MKKDDLVVVHTTYDATDAEIVRIALENERIACVIDNERQASLTGVLAIKVYVRASDADLARKVLAQSQQSGADDDSLKDSG